MAVWEVNGDQYREWNEFDGSVELTGNIHSIEVRCGVNRPEGPQLPSTNVYLATTLLRPADFAA